MNRFPTSTINKTGYSIMILGLALVLPFLSCKKEKRTFTPTSSIQLSSPRVQVDSLIFKKNATISLALEEDGADIYYTIAGMDSKERMSYKEPVVIDKTTKIQFWAEHETYQPSDAQEIVATKMVTDLSGADVVITPYPHINYPGRGTATLIDATKGTVNFRKGSEWLGFQDKEVSVSLQFPHPTPVSKVLVGILTDHNSWIFMPSAIVVEAHQNIMGSLELPYPSVRKKSSTTFLEVKVEKGDYENLIVNIFGLEAIPDWHEGSGYPPWLFIDEILIEP